MDLPKRIEVVIEVPRGAFVKRRGDGRVDFVSPIPSPFNYGSIVGTAAPDGDPLDAVVLGRRLERGARVCAPARAVAAFVDAGVDDPKVICASHPISALELRAVAAFFRFYALAKRARYAVLGHVGGGETRFGGCHKL